MSQGLPPIVFDHYGPSEILGENCGVKISHNKLNSSQIINKFVREILKFKNNKNYYLDKSKESIRRSNQLTWENLPNIYD